MSLLAQAKADIEQITSNKDEWGAEITMIAPSSETVVLTGLHSKHHLGLDTDGNRVNSKNAHISVSEQFLTDSNYPVRNPLSGQVNLKGHRVLVKDSTNAICKYTIIQWFPNETIGLITCILGDFE